MSACEISIERKANVRLEHNQKYYIVNYKDLLKFGVKEETANE